MRQLKLCPQCAGRISEAYRITRLTKGPSYGVRCDNCQRMTVGSLYLLEGKKENRGIWEGRQNE